MNIPGLNKVADAIGDAFSVFDFSFFISGAVTCGFLALDLHYYGHDGILQIIGWKSVAIYIIAVYVAGLMSWSCGKFFRWIILYFIWYKSNGISGDFQNVIKTNIEICGHQNDIVNDEELDVLYTKMWLYLNKKADIASKMASLNKMWVMIAVYEGLIFSWIVGLMVYLDGVFIGGWIKYNCVLHIAIPIVIFLILIASSFIRAIVYSRDLIKEVVVTYYENHKISN